MKQSGKETLAVDKWLRGDIFIGKNYAKTCLGVVFVKSKAELV